MASLSRVLEGGAGGVIRVEALTFRRGTEDDLPDVVELWNQNYPLAAYSLQQTTRNSNGAEAQVETIRWLARDPSGLAACLKLLIHDREDGPCVGDLSYCVRPGTPTSGMQKLLKDCLEEAESRGLREIWLWDQSGMGYEPFWHLNGFRHKVSMPFLVLHVDRADHLESLAPESPIDEVLTFSTAHDWAQQGRDWITPISRLAALVEQGFGVPLRSITQGEAAFREYYSAFDDFDRRLTILMESEGQLAGFASYRLDPLKSNSLLQNFGGTRPEYTGGGVEAAMYRWLLKWAIGKGVREICLGGEFAPGAVPNWVSLGFEPTSPWRRYKRELAGGEA